MCRRGGFRAARPRVFKVLHSSYALGGARSVYRREPQDCIILAEDGFQPRQPVGTSPLFWVQVFMMANGNRVAPEDKQTQEIKKPYNKPAFRFERVFETQALSCGKVQSVMAQCHRNRKTS